LGNRLAEGVRISVISGTVSGLHWGAVAAGFRLVLGSGTYGKETVLEAACIATASKEADPGDDADLTEALRHVTPERLIRELHFENLSSNPERGRYLGSMLAGAIVGGVLSYSFYAWTLGHRLANGLSPVNAIADALHLGASFAISGFGTITLFGMYCEYSAERKPIELEKKAGFQKIIKRLTLLQLNQEELLEAIGNVYAKVPESEKKHEAAVRKQLNLPEPVNT
jgi:hypothetical protein